MCRGDTGGEGDFLLVGDVGRDSRDMRVSR